MNIDVFLTDEGYIDKDGCYWGYPKDFIQGYILDFCCCGCPEENLMYIRDFLWSLENISWKEREKHFGSDAFYFISYVMDEKEFTEHGSSVPGWLTEKGKRLLEDLIELYGEPEMKGNN